ncbi:MAG: hypothetical protein Q4A37_02800 [Candidatus Saccharibacteria bacterium]|nr:hypothetical protein [Candidatus Saccharibacteria bacterium]
MNPELPPVRATTEVAPQIPGGVEFVPGGYQPEQQAPQYETAPVEHAPVMPQQMPVATAPVEPVPQVVSVPQDPSAGLASGAPSLAGDDDLIEKEWVDKLKKIISLTRDDPYERARVIAQLQADYLKKRYNKTLGQAEY